MGVQSVNRRVVGIWLLTSVAVALPAHRPLEKVCADGAKQGEAVQTPGGCGRRAARHEGVAPKETSKAEVAEATPVMLILDCSGSMARPLSQNAPKPKPPGQPRAMPPRRIDVAREALRHVLGRLVDQPYAVGVMVYGHRAGWSPANMNQIVLRGGVPGLHPNEDVETVLRLGRFSRAEYDDILQRLDKLEPLGETPLYLSILEAIDQLPPRPESQKRHIVVITDGLNEQWPDPNGPADKRKSAADVRDRLKSPAARGIRLDVVGFDLALKDDDGIERRQKLDELKELAESTGGRFRLVGDQATIAAALEESLGLGQVPRPGDGRAKD